MFRVQTPFLWVGLGTDYRSSLVGWVGHGFNIILVWVRIGLGSRFVSLSWVWVEWLRIGSGIGSAFQPVQGSSAWSWPKRPWPKRPRFAFNGARVVGVFYITTLVACTIYPCSMWEYNYICYIELFPVCTMTFRASSVCHK